MAPRVIELPRLAARNQPDAGRPKFVCKEADSHGCQGEVHVRCERRGEFVEVIEVDCATSGQICDVERECVVCRAGTRRCRDCSAAEPGSNCNPDVIEVCSDDGSAYTQVDECGRDKPDVCYQGGCINACDLARTQNSYAGCNFYAADLDNAALDDANNASAQQYAVVVANPQRKPVDVRIELNSAPYGQSATVQEVDHKRVPPGDLEVFKLPRREVDGSSQNGINDGTHSALSSNGYQVISDYPITAYQFNPLENNNVFSNDASLLLPTPALGTDYTVVGWPQTIGNSDTPDQDFDRTSSNEDLRAFLTILGVEPNTTVDVELGTKVVQVVGAPPMIAGGKPGDVLPFVVGPFDVINLETQGFNADFTGSHIHASGPVAVFIGSEASDVPLFGTYATRQCCADHLEEQLLPDSSAGTRFVVGRMPSRTTALNNAALPGAPLGVAEVDEPEWIRVVTTSAGRTRIRTSLSGPDADFTLTERNDVILRADRDFVIDADKPIHVLEAVASQGVTGIPKQYPGGDPSIMTVPPVEQFRRDYIFLTPDKYAFDFVTIVAPSAANIQLDGSALPSDTCTSTDIDALPGDKLSSEAQWVAHRCQLSFPEVTNGTSGGLMGGSTPSVVHVLPGIQHDGAHTIVSDREISIVVYGFDRFVSYGYVGGLNLTVLN